MKLSKLYIWAKQRAISSCIIKCMCYNVNMTKTQFYNSKAWHRVRAYIRLKFKGVCQQCGLNGTHVHHIVYITDGNIHDLNITLNENNLTLLCHDCHNFIHMDSQYLRNDVMFDEQGNLIERKRHK